MAQEIFVEDVRKANKPGFLRIDLVFFFPISAPATDATAVAAIPTPSSGLPTVAAREVDVAVKTALDNGTMMFITKNFIAPEGMSQANMLARARQIYAAEKAAAETKYAETYAWFDRVGLQLDAV